RSTTRTCARAITARCARSTGRATPTTRTRRSTASATGGAAAARARARPRRASRRGRPPAPPPPPPPPPPPRPRRPHGRRPPAAAAVGGVTGRAVAATPTRCPDATIAAQMMAAVEAARKDGNSLGGVVACAARHCPAGWGEPVFDRLEADLAKAMLSLPASKGFEVGSGFAGTDLTGREHNDEFYMDGDRVRTRSNRSGGVQGGITNGETVYFRVAFKPTATIMSPQRTVSVDHEDTTIMGRGRHDPCVLPRAVPMVEAMAALVLADHALRHQAIASK